MKSMHQSLFGPAPARSAVMRPEDYARQAEESRRRARRMAEGASTDMGMRDYLERTRQLQQQARPAITDMRYIKPLPIGAWNDLPGMSMPLPTAPAVVGGNVDWTNAKVTPLTNILAERLQRRPLMPGSFLKLSEPNQNSLSTL